MLNSRTHDILQAFFTCSEILELGMTSEGYRGGGGAPPHDAGGHQGDDGDILNSLPVNKPIQTSSPYPCK